jgi:hypothetical protein
VKVKGNKAMRGVADKEPFTVHIKTVFPSSSISYLAVLIPTSVMSFFYTRIV